MPRSSKSSRVASTISRSRARRRIARGLLVSLVAGIQPSVTLGVNDGYLRFASRFARQALLPSAPDHRAIVEAGYDAVADRYATLESPERQWPRMRWLRDLLGRLEDGARVLDVGCGNGLPATREIADRHRAVGVDMSRAQIDRARENVPGAEFRHSDLTGAEFSGRFAAITAFYVIEHLPRTDHAAVFERFHRWLEPGGYLLFTVEPADEPGVVGDWLGSPMFFSQYGAGTTLRLLREAGFEVLETSIERQLEGEREVSYLWVLAQSRPVDERLREEGP